MSEGVGLVKVCMGEGVGLKRVCMFVGKYVQEC